VINELRVAGYSFVIVTSAGRQFYVLTSIIIANLSILELYMGWVDPRVGLGWMGWVEIFQFLLGWVGSTIAKVVKI